MIKIYFILFFSTLHCISQSNSKLTVHYKLYCAPRDEASQNSFREFGITNEAVVQDFTLYVNDSITYYLSAAGLDKQKMSEGLCVVGSFYINPIYYSKNKVFSYKPSNYFGEFPENKYLITKSAVNNWTITSISKVIDGKLCYKATYQDSYNFKIDKKIGFEVTAWFCPEIPVQFGPSFYNNLPGLVLEVNYLRNTIIASKILYGVDEKYIQKPTGKEAIDNEEFIVVSRNRLIEYKGELEKELKKQETKN